jgi:hypothetical protein
MVRRSLGSVGVILGGNSFSNQDMACVPFILISKFDRSPDYPTFIKAL